MAEVERNWFRRVLAEGQAPPTYDPQADPDGPAARAQRPPRLRVRCRRPRPPLRPRPGSPFCPGAFGLRGDFGCSPAERALAGAPAGDVAAGDAEARDGAAGEVAAWEAAAREGAAGDAEARDGSAGDVAARDGAAGDGAAGESAARDWAGADALARAARPGPSGVLALGGSGRGWRGRTDGPPLVDSSAAASCSGRGRDTSLARMAALSVIFIPGMDTLHRYPFQPAVNQSREACPIGPASLRCTGTSLRCGQTCRWRAEASRRGVYCAAGDVRPATARRVRRGRRPCPADATARRPSRGRRPCLTPLRRWSGTRARDPRTSRPTVPRARRRAPPWPAPPGPGSRGRSRRDTPRPAWLRAG